MNWNKSNGFDYEVGHKDEPTWITTEGGKHIQIESETGEILKGNIGQHKSKGPADFGSMSDKPTNNPTNNPRNNPSNNSGMQIHAQKVIPTKMHPTKPKAMKQALTKAYESVPEESRWRVSTDYSEKDYEGMHCFTSEGGSCYAIHNGDIVSVCAKAGDMSGREILESAVKRGGKKLDAFSGIGGFYLKCGFEPVAYCKFDKNYAPKGWKEGRDAEEPVIFYKYTGNKFSGSSVEATKKIKEWLSATKPEADYDSAMAKRDMEVE